MKTDDHYAQRDLLNPPLAMVCDENEEFIDTRIYLCDICDRNIEYVNHCDRCDGWHCRKCGDDLLCDSANDGSEDGADISEILFEELGIECSAGHLMDAGQLWCQICGDDCSNVLETYKPRGEGDEL